MSVMSAINPKFCLSLVWMQTVCKDYKQKTKGCHHRSEMCNLKLIMSSESPLWEDNVSGMVASL